MVRSESREYFTQQESEDEDKILHHGTFTSNKRTNNPNPNKNKKNDSHKNRHHQSREKTNGQKQTITSYHINDGTCGNIFITPAHSTSSHKYRTPFAGSCQNSFESVETFVYNDNDNANANGDDDDCVQYQPHPCCKTSPPPPNSKHPQRNRKDRDFQCEMTPQRKRQPQPQSQRVSITPPLRKSPRNPSQTRRRSRSLSIHIRPLTCDPQSDLREVDTENVSNKFEFKSPRNPTKTRARKCRKHVHNLSFEDCEECKFRDDHYRRSQVAKSPCHSTWGPAYRPPPSNCPSNSSQAQNQNQNQRRNKYQDEVKSPQSGSSSGSSSSENSPGPCFSRNRESYTTKTRACPVYQPEISSKQSRASDPNLIMLEGEIIPYQVAQNLQEDRKSQLQSQSQSQAKTNTKSKSETNPNTDQKARGVRGEIKPSIGQIELDVEKSSRDPKKIQHGHHYHHEKFARNLEHLREHRKAYESDKQMADPILPKIPGDIQGQGQNLNPNPNSLQNNHDVSASSFGPDFGLGDPEQLDFGLVYSQTFVEREMSRNRKISFSQNEEEHERDNQPEPESEPQEKRENSTQDQDFLSQPVKNSNSGHYDQDVHFTNIQDLPRPQDVRKMKGEYEYEHEQPHQHKHNHHHSKHHRHHHHEDDECSSRHSDSEHENERRNTGNTGNTGKHKHHHRHQKGHQHGNSYSDSNSKRPHKSKRSPESHHHHHQSTHDETSGACETSNVFPFRKSPSGNLKILHNQVAFQSKQVAVLVNDPKRTRVQLKQERFRFPDCGNPRENRNHEGFYDKSKKNPDSNFRSNAHEQNPNLNLNMNSDCCYSSKNSGPGPPPPIPPFCSDDHESPPSPPRSHRSRQCSGGNPNFSQSQPAEAKQKQSPRPCSKPHSRSGSRSKTKSKSRSRSRSREKSPCKKKEADQTQIQAQVENCSRVVCRPAKETEIETVPVVDISEDELPFWESQTQNQCRNSGDFHECLHYRLRRAIHPDTKVIIGTKEFPCHSIALQAYSKYFDCIKRPTDSVHRIHLPKEIISAEDFPNLMDWILHNEACKPLVISKENVVALYSAAKCLGIPGLEEHCLSFINEKIESGDPLILQLYDDARRKKKCKELLCSLSSKLAHLFPLLYKSRQFLSLGPQEIIRLIDSDQVKIQSELDIYDAAARWLLYDWDNRREFAVRVMKCVRFGLLSPLQLTQIRHCADASNMPDYSHIYSFPEIKDMLCDGLTYAIFKECYKTRPGELNKWIQWSKVQPPKQRYNADGNPDVFRMPARVPVDGYPIYESDAKETCGKRTQGNQNSCLTNSTNEECAVRDQHCKGKGQGQISSPRKPETGEKCGNASWRQSHRPPKPQRSSSASPRASNGKDKRRSFPSESSYTSPFSSTNEKNNHGDTSEASNSQDGNTKMGKKKERENPYSGSSTFEQIIENPSQSFDVDLDTLLDTCLNQNSNNSGRRDNSKSSTPSKKPQETQLQKSFDNNANSITIHTDMNTAKLPPKSPRAKTGKGEMYGKIHEEAATKIQAHYRGHLIQRQYLEMKAAATTIQKQYRSYHQNQRQNQNQNQNQHHRQQKSSSNKILRERVRRLSIADKDVVVIFGGMNPQEELSSSNNCQNIYRFNPEENLWAEMGKMPEPRSHCGVVYDRERIFVFGGTDPRKQTEQGKNIPSSTCWSLDPTAGNGKWRVMANMKIPRANFGYCKFRGKIYVFGGKDANGKALSSCEKFDPSVGQSGLWELIPPMQKPCMSMAVAKFGDKIFVVGGVSMSNSNSSSNSNPKSPDTSSNKRPISKTVLVYEPSTNSWSYRTPLKFGRCYSQLTGHYNQLFLVGGAGKETNGDRTKSLQDVTVFEDGEWETVGKLKRARHGHALVKIGKHLLIMGGVSSESMEPLDTVEIYNIETNRASSKVSSMPRKLTGMAAVVL